MLTSPKQEPIYVSIYTEIDFAWAVFLALCTQGCIKGHLVCHLSGPLVHLAGGGYQADLWFMFIANSYLLREVL